MILSLTTVEIVILEECCLHTDLLMYRASGERDDTPPSLNLPGATDDKGVTVTGSAAAAAPPDDDDPLLDEGLGDEMSDADRLISSPRPPEGSLIAFVLPLCHWSINITIINYRQTSIVVEKRSWMRSVNVWANQMMALLIKRMLHTWRNRILTMVQMKIPLLFTTLGLLAIRTMPRPEDSPPLILDLSPYDKTVIGHAHTPNTVPEAMAISYARHLASGRGVKTVDVTALTPPISLIDYFIKQGTASLPTYANQYLIGADFIHVPVGENGTWTVGYFDNQAFHSPAISLGAVMNAILGLTNSSSRITTVNHPMPRTSADKINDEMNNNYEGFVVALYLTIGMSFLVGSFVLFLVKERECKAKLTQLLSGVSSSTFWAATFIWDMANFMIPCLLLLLVMVAFGIKAYLENSHLAIILLLLVLYAWAVLPMTYLVSFLFTVPSSAMVWWTMFNVLSGELLRLVLY